MTEPFERAAVLARFNNDRELVAEMARLFAEYSALWLTEIRAALAGNDFQQARRVAHTLKGSAGNFLAHDTLAKAAALEGACQAGQADAAQHAFVVVETAVGELNDALKGLVPNECSPHAPREDSSRGA